jgi:pantocin A family RiPP
MIIGCKLCSHRSSGETEEKAMYNHEEHIMLVHIIDLAIFQDELMQQDQQAFGF